MTDPQTYHPLLPKTTRDLPGGNAPGEWIGGAVKVFKEIADRLDFEGGNFQEVNSVPSPWSRPLQFVSAFRNEKYPNRPWLIAQYRGFLAALALAENLKLKITATAVNLQSYQNTDFGKCLWTLRPNPRDTILSLVPPEGPWSEFYLFEVEDYSIGITSPATLVAPQGYLAPLVERRIPWVKGGFFADPIANGLTPSQKLILAPWLENLRGQLLAKPANEELAGKVAGVIAKFVQDLDVTESAVFQPSVEAVPYGVPLTPAPLSALYPARAVAAPSNVQVLPSAGKGSQRRLYVIDERQLPGILGRDPREINVIDSSPLPGFDPDRHRRADALFVTPADLFTDNLYYRRSRGLLPGAWLDQKLNLEDLSILLPLGDFMGEFFTSRDLENQVSLSAVNTPEGPGVRVSLTLRLSGFGNPVNYPIYKDFPLRPENELKQEFPTLALWPNVPPGSWREYFLLVEKTEDFGGLAFTLEQPCPGAVQELRKSGQEVFQYWKCDQFPDILAAIDGNARFLGLIPLKVPVPQVGSAQTWSVGVDFGTSFTNIYVRKGSGQPERLQLQTHLLKITRTLEDVQAITYREFFAPEGLIPEGENPPLSTVLTTRGWRESEGLIPAVMSDARVYVPRLDRFDFDKDYIKTNIKWQQVQYQRPFLGQLARLIAAQAANEEVRTLNWAISYPSAFSTMETNGYENSWRTVLKQLETVSGQSHDDLSIRTESVAFAQFFADSLGKNLVHTTCVDIGGGTSDISLWQENTLVHQASVPYAGRDIFHRILQPNLAFIGDIFGLPPEAAKSVRQVLSSKTNFNSALDTYLRGNADRILADGYVMNAGKQRNREFRSLVAFALGGLFHYLGLTQKYLGAENKLLNQTRATALLLGGHGSRFLHWLSPTGNYTSKSEVNNLARGLLVLASDLTPNPDLITLSDRPKQETCCGLVVSPGGTKLDGLEQKQKDYPFVGETCVINGAVYRPGERLKLDGAWEEIEEFRIPNLEELERYLTHFNQVIQDENIQEIDPLRNFSGGGLLTLNANLKTLLETEITKTCLQKKGAVGDFEPEPPFLLALRCLVGLLADQWAKTGG
ncbi:MAG: hypothetical protein ACK5CA_05595 [Cyanobacteriota bacterium]|jgi:hypothetical protein